MKIQLAKLAVVLTAGISGARGSQECSTTNAKNSALITNQGQKYSTTIGGTCDDAINELIAQKVAANDQVAKDPSQSDIGTQKLIEARRNADNVLNLATNSTGTNAGYFVNGHDSVNSEFTTCENTYNEFSQNPDPNTIYAGAKGVTSSICSSLNGVKTKCFSAICEPYKQDNFDFFGYFELDSEENQLWALGGAFLLPILLTMLAVGTYKGISYCRKPKANEDNVDAIDDGQGELTTTETEDVVDPSNVQQNGAILPTDDTTVNDSNTSNIEQPVSGNPVDLEQGLRRVDPVTPVTSNTPSNQLSNRVSSVTYGQTSTGHPVRYEVLPTGGNPNSGDTTPPHVEINHSALEESAKKAQALQEAIAAAQTKQLELQLEKLQSANESQKAQLDKVKSEKKSKKVKSAKGTKPDPKSGKAKTKLQQLLDESSSEEGASDEEISSKPQTQSPSQKSFVDLFQPQNKKHNSNEDVVSL